jgi:hypothetical protein
MDLLIENLFKILNNSNEYIHEFDIVDLRPNESEYLFEENYLALNKIHAKKLYPYLRKQFLERDTISLTNSQRDAITLLISLIHPQFSSVWSQRKQLLCDGFIKDEHELRLNKLVLNKNCKSELAYMHRRWIVKRLNVQSFHDFIDEECELVFKLSKKIKSNYYCWSYLNWIFDYFKNRFQSTQFLFSVLNKHQKNVLELSVSDYCVFHFRLNFLKLFVLETKSFQNNDLSSIIKSEYEIFDDFLFRYKKYQTVWNYRKYFFKLIDSIGDFYIENLTFPNYLNLIGNDEGLRDDIFKCRNENDNLLSYLLKREIILTNFVKKVSLTSLDFDTIENYANQHLDFIKKFYNFK